MKNNKHNKEKNEKNKDNKNNNWKDKNWSDLEIFILPKKFVKKEII